MMCGLHCLRQRLHVVAGICILMVSICHAQAGVMRAGTWSIETHFVSAEGPGSRKAAGVNPLVSKVCMTPAFVDQDNYSNPDFSMGRSRRLGFDCQLTTRAGGRTSASWSYACSRFDGFAIQGEIEAQIGEHTLTQRGMETTTKDGDLWSRAVVRIEAKLQSEQCESGLQQLR